MQLWLFESFPIVPDLSFLKGRYYPHVVYTDVVTDAIIERLRDDFEIPDWEQRMREYAHYGVRWGRLP